MKANALKRGFVIQWTQRRQGMFVSATRLNVSESNQQSRAILEKMLARRVMNTLAGTLFIDKSCPHWLEMTDPLSPTCEWLCQIMPPEIRGLAGFRVLWADVAQVCVYCTVNLDPLFALS